MNAELNPAASAHLPIFITAPGHTDVGMVAIGFFLLGAVIGFGVLFFWLHSLPERIAHKSNKLQFEIVAVLGLLSLFTHEHLFWIIGLLLAVIDLPDFGGWMNRIATSTETIAGAEQRISPATSLRPSELGEIPSADGKRRSAAREDSIHV